MSELSDVRYLVLPYGGKLSREKAFAFFAVLEPSVKVFKAKFCGHTYIIIGRTGAIRESFLREILVLYRNVKLFLPRKYSAIRYLFLLKTPWAEYCGRVECKQDVVLILLCFTDIGAEELASLAIKSPENVVTFT